MRSEIICFNEKFKKKIYNKFVEKIEDKDIFEVK